MRGRPWSGYLPDMSEAQINISDPKVWNNLPVETRISAITELQSILVTSSLRYSPFGAMLVKRREDGVNLTKEMLLIEHKNEKSVSLRDRRAMGDSEWQVRLWPVGPKLPTGVSKRFASVMKTVRTHPVPAGSDLFCAICSDGKVYLTTISLDAYLKAITLPPTPIAEKNVVDVAPEPDTFESIVALISGVAPTFDWSDWLDQRVEDGTEHVLPGAEFDAIRPRVTVYIEKAHVGHLETRRQELNDRLKQLRELSAPDAIIQADEEMLGEVTTALALRDKTYTTSRATPTPG